MVSGSQPQRGFGADEDEDRAAGDRFDRFAALAFQFQLFDVPVAVDGGHLGPLVDLDVRRRADAGGEVVGHARAEHVADQHVDRPLPAAFGEEHRGLSGGIACAHHRHVLRLSYISASTLVQA